MLENFMTQYKDILYFLAEMSAGALEFVGVIIIIVGSFRALVRLIKSLATKSSFKGEVDLEKSLSLALEFKMGAEIIKTVIIHNLEELAILGVVIVIRALLSVMIHWEIHIKEKEKRLKEAAKTTEEKK